MNKKILALILSLMLMVQFLPLASYAEETVPAGFEFSELGNEYALLKALNIAETSDDIISKKTVTRGEFAALAVKSINYMPGSDTSAIWNFSDVSSKHPYAGGISAIVNLGFMKGNSGDAFRPDDNITLEQAACVAVRMLNADKALTVGNTMPDYVSAAARLGIFEGISTSDYSRPAHRAEVYIILYNVIQTPVYLQKSYTDEPTYTIDEDRTILTEYWNIKKARGLVWADDMSSINGERTSVENSLNIQGKIFLSTTETTLNTVGRELEFFYFDDKSDPVICFAYAPDSEVIELGSESIVYFDYANGIYSTEIDGKEKNFRIGDEYYLSYNGDAILGSDPELMNPKHGSVTLISNGTGVYDVVIVREYYNIIVDYYDPYNNTIVDMFDKSLNVCLDDYEQIEGIDDFGKLSRYNIISVIKTPSGNKLKLYRSTQTLVGTVTEYSSGSEPYVYIDGRKQNLKGDIRFNTSAIEPGRTHTFYIDYYGNATYMTVSGMQGGVILNYNNPTGISDRQCLVLSKTGTVTTYTLADSISVRDYSGTGKMNQDEVVTFVPEHSTVLFDINSLGEINEIVLPMVINTEDEYKNLPDYPLFKVDYFLREWPTSLSPYNQYHQEINGFANWLIMDSGTVMQIPLSPDDACTDENTMAFSITELRDKYEITVNTDPGMSKLDGEIEVYQTSSDYCAPSILVIHGGSSNGDAPLDTDNMPYIITGITQGYDEVNDKTATKIEYVGMNGKVQSAFLADEELKNRAYLLTQDFGGAAVLHSSKQTLAIGDIIQLSQRSDDGRIGRIAILYDRENDNITYSNLTGYNRIFRLWSAKAEFVYGTYFECINASSNALERTNLKNAAVIVFQENQRGQTEVKSGTRADIMPGDRVVIYTRYINNRLVFVYKQ